MTTTQRFITRYKRLGQDLASAMAQSHHTRAQGECPHCKTNTVWAVRALNGFFRCMRCGKNPLDASRSADRDAVAYAAV